MLRNEEQRNEKDPVGVNLLFSLNQEEQEYKNKSMHLGNCMVEK